MSKAEHVEKAYNIDTKEPYIENNDQTFSPKSDDNYELCEIVQNSPINKKSYSCESILIANLSIDDDSNKKYLFNVPDEVSPNQKYEDEFNSLKIHHGK